MHVRALTAIVLVLNLATTVSGAKPGAELTGPVFPCEIQSEDVRPHIETLAGPGLRGRAGRDSRRAAEYVVGQFRELRLQPLFANQSYFQSIPGSPEPDGTRPEVGRNIGAVITGSDPDLKHEYIVVGVHYDHLGTIEGEIFAGADDNASGVAMMLSVAKKLKADREFCRRSVVFIGFDLEEQMLWGSRWFAAHAPWPLEQVKLFITADMIGRSLGDLPLPAVFVLGSEHSAQVKLALDRVGQPAGLDVARLGIDLVGTRSDYGPFRDREVPFLFFSTGEHPDYHTPRDTPARIDYAKAARVSSLVLKLVREVGSAETAPQWSPALAGDLDEPRALERITTLMLEADDQNRLTDVQRYILSTVRNRTRRILENGEMTADDRTWLVRMAQLLLLSVF